MLSVVSVTWAVYTWKASHNTSETRRDDKYAARTGRTGSELEIHLMLLPREEEKEDASHRLEHKLATVHNLFSGTLSQLTTDKTALNLFSLQLRLFHFV